MMFYAFAFLFAVAQAADFSVKDKDNNTCLMLTLEGSLNLTATPTNSSGDTPPPVSLDFKDAKGIDSSNCTLIKLDMTKSAEVWFQFEESSGTWEVTPISAFNALTVFGKDLDNETVTFKAGVLDVFDTNSSLLCKTKVEHEFTEQGSPSSKYNFSVVASTQNFQIQALNGSSFAHAQECAADPKPTSSTPATTTTPTKSSSTTPASTTTPPEPVVNATCKVGNVTSIRLTGSFQLAITYNATDAKKKTSLVTKYIEVPANVDTSSSKCEANATMESLVMKFFNGWSITFDILSDSSSLQLTAGTKEYHVANITVTYVYDEHLPNAVMQNQTVDVTYKDGGKNYLKASSSGYYTCKANTSISMGQNAVKLTSVNLKYMAFNNKANDEFTGDVSECSADDDTSSVVPIAVGAALAGLVVIVLIAYLIGRKRSRKSGYESV